MNKLRFILSLRKSHDAFRRERAVAVDEPFPMYDRFLRELGFAELVYQVLLACVLYPCSIEACRDCVSDLSHSLYQQLGIGRMSQTEQERLTRLVDLVGDEVFKTIEPHGFYDRDFDKNFMEYDDITASVEVNRISETTFDVTVLESRDETHHHELSDKSFGVFNTSHWSH